MHETRYSVLTTKGSELVEVVEPLDEPWEAAYRIESQDGLAVIAGVQIRLRQADPERDPMETVVIPPGLAGPKARKIRRPVPPSVPHGGLSARQARGLRPGEALAEFRRRTDRFLSAPEDQVKVGEDHLFFGSAPPKSGRRDRYYAEIAAIYVEMLSNGSRRPVVDAAEKLGAGHSVTYVRDVLNKARDRSLLDSPAGRGRASGKLTPRARQLLEPPV